MAKDVGVEYPLNFPVAGWVRDPKNLRKVRMSEASMKRMAQNYCGRVCNSQKAVASEPTRVAAAAVLLTLAVASASVNPGTAAAAAEACPTSHTVTIGDTLFKIAEHSYGDGWKYRQIFHANRGFLSSESSIEIGDTLLVPCLDGTGVTTRAEAVAIGLIASVNQPLDAAELGADDGGFLEATTEARDEVSASANTPPDTAASSAQIPIRFVAASRATPYYGSDGDQSLPHDGLITELVARAMALTAPTTAVTITAMDSRSANMENLLLTGAFDAGFPWSKPDCSGGARSGMVVSPRCTDFEYSKPIFEASVTFLTRSRSKLADVRTLADLESVKLCRSADDILAERDLADLMDTRVQIQTAASPAACITQLLAGRVDIVTTTRPDVGLEVQKIGLSNAIVEIPALQSKTLLHVMVPKSNPRASAIMVEINRGLAQLMGSGAWFEVVAYHQAQ